MCYKVCLDGDEREIRVIRSDQTVMRGNTCYTGYPLKLHFQIPCVFPVPRQIFPVTIYVICDYYIHKTDLADC